MKSILIFSAFIPCVFGGTSVSKPLNLSLFDVMEDDRMEAEAIAMIDAGKGWEGVNGKGNTVLIEAAENGKTDLLERILLRLPIISPNIGNFEGNTAAHVAAMKGHVKIIKVLSKWAADMSARNKKGKTPVQLAVKAGQGGVIKALMAEGNVDMNDPGGPAEQEINDFKDYEYYLMPPLHIAVNTFQEDIVEILLSDLEKVNVNEEGVERKIPLHSIVVDPKHDPIREWGVRSAVSKEKLRRIVDLLTAADCKPAIRDWEGYTPFHHSVCAGDQAAFEVFVEKIEEGLRDDRENSPWVKVLKMECWEWVIKEGNMEKKMRYAENPLQTAERLRRDEMIGTIRRLMMEAGEGVN